MYKFGRDNAKLQHLLPYLSNFLKFIGNSDAPKLYTFSKLSGHHCPFAKACLSKAIETPHGMKIQDGPHTQFRCFSASQEVLFPNVYASRKWNSELTKGKNVQQLAALIRQSLPADGNVFRIHIGGDFVNQADFDAWMMTAIDNPSRLFYAYTKSLPFWVARQRDIPTNLVLTASYGGWRDSMIAEHGLRFCNVVHSPADTTLPIDHDDSLAANPMYRRSFSLLLHGTQPKGIRPAEHSYKR
jgi:hypothetical protein